MDKIFQKQTFCQKNEVYRKILFGGFYGFLKSGQKGKVFQIVAKVRPELPNSTVSRLLNDPESIPENKKDTYIPIFGEAIVQSLYDRREQLNNLLMQFNQISTILEEYENSIENPEETLASNN